MAIDNPSNLMPDQEIIIEGDAGFVPKASPSDAGKVLGVLNSSGDVGWVVDQSGTFIQVQADWAETDSSQPSYIDHKPDLSVYATASSVETALAGKQDTISDLSEIRAGAAKGDTAVQPAALDDYATTSAMNTALAGKQDTISDLATIRSGAAAGATAVQPSALESYATTSAMNTALAGKQDVINDLSDIRSGAALGATAVQPATLESYATTSAMNTALAGKQDTISDLATIRAGAAAGATAAQPSDLPSTDELLPSATSSDAGKILSVDSNGDPEWITPSGGTTYSAGDGVSIDANNVISADVDGTTIGIDSTTKKIKSLQVIPTKTSDLQNDSNFVVASSLATVATSGSYADLSNKPAIPTKTSDLQNDSNFVSSSSLATVATTGSYNDLSDKPVIPPGVTVDQTYNASSANAQSGTAVAGAIAGVKQVPASTSADENKVLTVNSSGNPVWENSAVPASKPLVAGSNITITENTNDVTIAATNTTYTAGDGIDITSGVVSADVDGTTIGIDSTTKKIKSLQVIPTKTSDLQNDSNFVVASSLATVATSGSYADLSNKPTIPAAQVQSNYAQSDSSAVDYIKNKPDLSVYAQSANLATVATSGSYSDLSGKPTIPSVDQTYNAASANAQSGVAVAQAIAAIPAPSVDEVPDVTSSDDGKVLTAAYSGGTGSYSWQTGSQVDIKTEVVGGVTATTTTTGTFVVDIPYEATNATAVILKVSDSAVGDLGFSSNEWSNAYPVLTDPSGRNTLNLSGYPIPTEAAPSGSTYTRILLGEHTDAKSLTITLPASAISFLQRNGGGKLRLAYGMDSVVGYVETSLTSDLTVTLATPDAEQVVSEINDMKLKPGIPYPYTAGITDIQVVNSLPASPVATVLYLLPET